MSFTAKEVSTRVITHQQARDMVETMRGGSYWLGFPPMQRGPDLLLYIDQQEHEYKAAQELKTLVAQLVGNHERRTEKAGPHNEAYSALSVVNALKLKLKVLEAEKLKGGTCG